MHEFYVVALPGLEDIVEAEIHRWFPHLETQSEHGGVTVTAALADGLALNQVLKTPTRILLRVARFTCRDFPKLYKKMAGFKWQDLVDLSCGLEVHAASARSRLKIKTRLEKTCREGWAAAQKAAEIKTRPDRQLDLYVRVLDNVCTLSLDTSGERLHKRGLRRQIGEAPLRESIAAALIQILRRHSDQPAAVELVDPMMGSGTFLLESLGSQQVSESREFAFAQFNAQPTPLTSKSPPDPRIESVVGYDLDPKTFQAAKENLKALADRCDLRLQDFHASEKLPGGRRRWLLCNPPYGERIKINGPMDQFYARLFQDCERIVRPELACFLLPAQCGRLQLPHNWKVIEKRRLSNGGISVIAFVFKRSGPSA